MSSPPAEAKAAEKADLTAVRVSAVAHEIVELKHAAEVHVARDRDDAAGLERDLEQVGEALELSAETGADEGRDLVGDLEVEPRRQPEVVLVVARFGWRFGCTTQEADLQRWIEHQRDDATEIHTSEHAATHRHAHVVGEADEERRVAVEVELEVGLRDDFIKDA